MINRPIGVFDSGIGGLTVLKALLKTLPKERFIYFGDTARVPYGNKSQAVVLAYSREILHFLIQKNVKAVVVACNTASALALPLLKKMASVPIFGVVEAGAKAAAKLATSGKIAVIGTKSTITSNVYAKYLKKLIPKASVQKVACPLFVPLVEEGWINHPITEEIARIYLKDIVKKHPDVLVLGCTHYPLLKQVLAKILNNKTKTKLVDSPSAVAEEVKKELFQKEILATAKPRSPRVHFFVSDDPKAFKKMARLFLGNEPRGPVTKVQF